jgi:hypothetical protein
MLKEKLYKEDDTRAEGTESYRSWSTGGLPVVTHLLKHDLYDSVPSAGTLQQKKDENCTGTRYVTRWANKDSAG